MIGYLVAGLFILAVYFETGRASQPWLWATALVLCVTVNALGTRFIESRPEGVQDDDDSVV